MKKNFLFGLLALMLAGFWFGGASLADSVTVKTACGEETTSCYTTLAEAIASEGTTIEVSEGTYDLNNVSFTKTVTIKGIEDNKADVIIKGPETCSSVNSIGNSNVKAGTLNDGVTVTFEGVTLDLGEKDCAGQGFAGDHEKSTVIIRNSTVKGRLTTFTNMEFDTVVFSDTPSYNVDVHRGFDVKFSECTFEGPNRNINVYDWNNDGGAEHNVTFDNCKFESGAVKKGAIVIHESHTKLDYTVKYNVVVKGDTELVGSYPQNKHIIWRGNETTKKEGGYYSMIVAKDGLIMIDDIRRVINAGEGDIEVTVDNEVIYKTPATTAVNDIGIDELSELQAVVDWYRSEGYCIGEWNGNDLIPDGVGATEIIITEATDETAEAKIGDKKYCKLDDAIEFADNGDTITLLKDIESDHQIKIEKPLTLDGDNHKLNVTHENKTAEDGAGILVKGTSNVTIKNLKVDGPNKGDSPTWVSNQHVIKVYNSTNVILDTVEVNHGSEAMHFNGSTVTLKGDITVGSNCTYGGFEVTNNSTVNLSEANIDKSVWLWDDTESDGSTVVGDQWVKTTENNDEGTPTFKQYNWNQTKQYKATFKDGETVLKEIDVEYGNTVSYGDSNPTKSCYTFAGWNPEIPTTMPAENVVMTAKWTYSCSSSSGGGGSRTTTKTDDAKATTGDTAKVDEQKTDDSKSDEAKADETKTSEEAKAVADAQALKDGYSQEFIDAYNFARKNNITTKDTIREADMDAPLTRIAMAKMLSQYAINVLGKTPDTSIVVPNFPDVDAKLDADYNNGVTLAYQLGIMGIGIQKFRPFDLVTRAEFGTALSRMLFGLEDGEGNEWYSTHLAKLMEEKIITNNNPNLKELRGYVMIMLMRSAQ